MDNTAAMACFNKIGSTKSEKIKYNYYSKVWQWYNTRNLPLTVEQIAGYENTEADHKSRYISISTQNKPDFFTVKELTLQLIFFLAILSQPIHALHKENMDMLIKDRCFSAKRSLKFRVVAIIRTLWNF